MDYSNALYFTGGTQNQEPRIQDHRIERSWANSNRTAMEIRRIAYVIISQITSCFDPISSEYYKYRAHRISQKLQSINRDNKMIKTFGDNWIGGAINVSKMSLDDFITSNNLKKIWLCQIYNIELETIQNFNVTSIGLEGICFGIMFDLAIKYFKMDTSDKSKLDELFISLKKGGSLSAETHQFFINKMRAESSKKTMEEKISSSTSSKIEESFKDFPDEVAVLKDSDPIDEVIVLEVNFNSSIYEQMCAEMEKKYAKFSTNPLTAEEINMQAMFSQNQLTCKPTKYDWGSDEDIAKEMSSYGSGFYCIGFDTANGAHAISMIKNNDNTGYIVDPNYGTIKFNDNDQAFEFLNTLVTFYGSPIDPSTEEPYNPPYHQIKCYKIDKASTESL